MLFIFPNRAFNMLYLTYYFSIRVFNEIISNSQFEVFKIYAISNACSVSSDFSFALLANLANFCWKLYMIYQAKRTWGFMTVWLEVRPLLVVEAIVLSFTSPPVLSGFPQMLFMRCNSFLIFRGISTMSGCFSYFLFLWFISLIFKFVNRVNCMDLFSNVKLHFYSWYSFTLLWHYSLYKLWDSIANILLRVS